MINISMAEQSVGESDGYAQHCTHTKIVFLLQQLKEGKLESRTGITFRNPRSESNEAKATEKVLHSVVTAPINKRLRSALSSAQI